MVTKVVYRNSIRKDYFFKMSNSFSKSFIIKSNYLVSLIRRILPIYKFLNIYKKVLFLLLKILWFLQQQYLELHNFLWNLFINLKFNILETNGI